MKYSYEDLSPKSKEIYDRIQKHIESGSFPAIIKIIQKEITAYNQAILVLDFSVKADLHVYKNKENLEITLYHIEAGSLAKIAVYAASQELLEELYHNRFYDPNILDVLFYKAFGGCFKEDFASLNENFFKILKTILENTKSQTLSLSLKVGGRDKTYPELLFSMKGFDYLEDHSKIKHIKECFVKMLEIDPNIVNYRNVDNKYLYAVCDSKALMHIALENAKPNYRTLKDSIKYRENTSSSPESQEIDQMLITYMNKHFPEHMIENPAQTEADKCIVM